MTAREHEGELHLDVQVQPRASRSAIVGVLGERVKVALAAPPVDGAANQELVQTLADLFGVPKRHVTIVRGLTGRKKTVHIKGATLAALHTLLASL
ncbi:MAG: DUF167 domain-containing protein [Deltaproteobacteria bacterium]|nr:DUF167 domain-containing protein [Deltaproteobacteria bacterium]